MTCLFNTPLVSSELPPVVTNLQMLEEKSPRAFTLSWGAAALPENNFSEPVVYVLQARTYFGPEFETRLASEWKTVVMVSSPLMLNHLPSLTIRPGLLVTGKQQPHSTDSLSSYWRLR
ncbi:unnamed protein product [Protopolystoma xenopodis]|uniref:Uncharacterized protein n=1 Tax=Protopolystoma xenopodis TaxID=117903 RepID=A0A3S5CTA1_9PLAT|nr:unnamed protein product [Protopolystoma xenopodis]